ncbi:MAG: YqgE/AlgH family protein [Bradymonadaceae bacterium]
MSTSSDDDSLAPGFLVAAPKLEGGPFERAVIAMVHHDDQGAMGFIVNKPVEIDFGSLLESAEHTMSDEIAEPSFDQPVMFGGPVRVEQLWVLYEGEGGADIDQTVSSPMDEMRDVRELSFHPNWVLAGAGGIIEHFASGERDEPYRPLIGYAGWGPGQLEGEIEEGSWLAVDFEEKLLLETDPEDCWEAALEVVGIDPASFMMMGGGGMA